MSFEKNKKRKAKLDMVAALLQERKLKWNRREDPHYTFVFVLEKAEIRVSPDDIKLMKDNESIDYFVEKFEEVLDSLIT